MFTRHSQCHGCWWPGDASSQGIRDHGIDLVLPVQWKPPGGDCTILYNMKIYTQLTHGPQNMQMLNQDIYPIISYLIKQIFLHCDGLLSMPWTENEPICRLAVRVNNHSELISSYFHTSQHQSTLHWSQYSPYYNMIAWVLAGNDIIFSIATDWIRQSVPLFVMKASRSLPLRDVAAISGMNILAFPVKLPSGECPKTPLMTSQHWFR